MPPKRASSTKRNAGNGGGLSRNNSQQQLQAASSPSLSRRSSSKTLQAASSTARPAKRKSRPSPARGRDSQEDGILCLGSDGSLLNADSSVMILEERSAECASAARECVVCGGSCTLAALLCPVDRRHSMCLECATSMARTATDAGRAARCDFCSGDDKPEFTPAQLHAAGVADDVVQAYSAALARALTEEAQCVFAPCPSQGCRFEGLLLADEALQPQPVWCQVCPTQELFCSKCQARPFHYGTSCVEAERLRRRFAEVLALMRGENEEARRLWQSAVDSERALERDKNTRCCPHCGTLIVRVAGCSAMVCGRDSEGSRRRVARGCGRRFNWDKAPRYKAQVPTMGMDRGHENKLHDDDMACVACGMSPIRGTRFECINCEEPTAVCSKCIVTFVRRHKHTFREVHPTGKSASTLARQRTEPTEESDEEDDDEEEEEYFEEDEEEGDEEGYE